MKTAADLIAVLQRHVGRENGISAAGLALALGTSERQVRQLVTEVRMSGTVALCAHPKHGYFIAASDEDVRQTCAFLKARAMESLKLAAKLSREPLEDLVGQLRLPT